MKHQTKDPAYAGFMKKLRSTAAHYGMFSKGDSILVGVSGGADSVALIRALAFLAPRIGVRVVAANLDHGIRGKESSRESLFVKKMVESLGLEYVSGILTGAGKNSKKISLEEELREKRYDFFKKSAESYDCNVIATGHNMDDQAETVLMRVIKGVSVEGLLGIPPVREDGGFRIVRPLIRVTRKEILSFLEKVPADHVVDSSNNDTKFLRNRIRLEVIPHLEKINPGIKEVLVNMADSLREEMSFSLEIKKRIAGDLIFQDRGGSSHIPVDGYMSAEPAVRKEVFKMLFSCSGGNVKKLSHRHWVLTDLFVFSKDKGKSLDLPGNIRIMKARGRMSISRGVKKTGRSGETVTK